MNIVIEFTSTAFSEVGPMWLKDRPVEFLWALLLFSGWLGCFGVICGVLTRRMTKGGKFGRVIDVVTGAVMGNLLFSLICVVEVVLGGVPLSPLRAPAHWGLECHLVMATVCSLVLLFIAKKLAAKGRSVQHSELHSN